MSLSVTTPAVTRRLTRKANVKTELGITSTSDDALFDSLIDEASAAIGSHCHRQFAREVYSEVLPGYGDIHLQLSRTPIIGTPTVTLNGSVITDFSVADRDAGWLYRQAGWTWTAQWYPGLSGGGSWLELGSIVPRSEEPQITVAPYVAGYILPEQNLLAQITVSAALADNSFNDSGNGFPAQLKAGDLVRVSGFATAANNGIFPVTGTPTAGKIQITGTLANEAAGPSVSVYFLPPPECRPIEDLEKAAIEAVKSWYLGRKDDGNIVEKQVDVMRVRYAESAGGRLYLPTSCVGLLRPWVRAA